MADTRDYAISARISAEAGRRLKALSKSRRQSFGEVLDALILGVPLAAVDWTDAIKQLRIELDARISRIESHLDTPPLSVITPIVTTPPDEELLPPIGEVIEQLGRSGLKPQEIANKLNEQGYRTKTGTLIQRGYVGNMLARSR